MKREKWEIKLTPFSKAVTVDVDYLVATGKGKIDGGAS
jgi:hypothetical protein